MSTRSRHRPAWPTREPIRACIRHEKDLRKYEHPPVSLMFREGVPMVIRPIYGSGCGSPAQECAEIAGAVQWRSGKDDPKGL